MAFLLFGQQGWELDFGCLGLVVKMCFLLTQWLVSGTRRRLKNTQNRRPQTHHSSLPWPGCICLCFCGDHTFFTTLLLLALLLLGGSKPYSSPATVELLLSRAAKDLIVLVSLIAVLMTLLLLLAASVPASSLSHSRLPHLQMGRGRELTHASSSPVSLDHRRVFLACSACTAPFRTPCLSELKCTPMKWRGGFN